MSQKKSCLVKQKQNKKTKKQKKGKGNCHESTKKKRYWTNCPCALAHEHFCPLSSLIFSLQFSLHFRKKTFWWTRGENTLDPTIYFSSSPPNTPKKNFFPFSLQNFPSTLFYLQTNTPYR